MFGEVHGQPLRGGLPASVSGKTAGLRENAVWPVRQMAIAANVIDFNFISFVYNVAE